MSKLVCHNGKFQKSAIRGLQIHNQRESNNLANKDIDRSRTHLNYDLVNDSPVNYTERWNEIMSEGFEYRDKKSITDKSVCVIDGLISSDKEFFDKSTPEQTREFFQTALDQYKEQFGEQNIISAAVHMDEKTPHMHIIYVPLTKDKRLCAKEVNDNKNLRQLQDQIPKKLQAKGISIERGIEGSNAKHKETNEYKREELKAQDRELQVKESEINRRMADGMRIDAKEKEVREIKDNTKDNKNWRGKPTGEVILKKDDFERLTASATAGAAALVEYRNLEKEIDVLKQDKRQLQSQNEVLTYEKSQLEQENTQLKTRLQVAERFMRDPQVAQRVQDIQNPHLAAYRDFKKEMGISIGAVRYGGEDKFDELAYRMTKAGFDRDQVREALRQDLNRDDSLQAMSNAGNRIEQERAAEQARAAAEQARVAQEQARQAEKARIAKRRETIAKNPNYSRFIEYSKQGYNPASAAYLMMKKDRIDSFRVKETVKFMTSEKYADKVMKLAKEYNPTQGQEKGVSRPSSGGVGGGGGASHQDTKNLLNSIDRYLSDSKVASLTMPMVNGDKDIDWDALTPDQVQDKVRELAREREDRGMEFGR